MRARHAHLPRERRALPCDVALVELVERRYKVVDVENDRAGEQTRVVDLVNQQHLDRPAHVVAHLEGDPGQRQPFAAHRDDLVRPRRDALIAHRVHCVQDLVTLRSRERDDLLTVDGHVIGRELFDAALDIGEGLVEPACHHTRREGVGFEDGRCSDG